MAGSVSDAFAGRPVISRGFFLLIHGVEIDRLQQQRWETAVGNEVVYMLTQTGTVRSGRQASSARSRCCGLSPVMVNIPAC